MIIFTLAFFKITFSIIYISSSGGCEDTYNTIINTSIVLAISQSLLRYWNIKVVYLNILVLIGVTEMI